MNINVLYSTKIDLKSVVYAIEDQINFHYQDKKK